MSISGALALVHCPKFQSSCCVRLTSLSSAKPRSNFNEVIRMGRISIVSKSSLQARFNLLISVSLKLVSKRFGSLNISDMLINSLLFGSLIGSVAAGLLPIRADLGKRDTNRWPGVGLQVTTLIPTRKKNGQIQGRSVITISVSQLKRWHLMELREI
jgi:hypothetical protein